MTPNSKSHLEFTAVYGLNPGLHLNLQQFEDGTHDIRSIPTILQNIMCHGVHDEQKRTANRSGCLQ